MTEGYLLYNVLRSPFAEGPDIVDGDVDEAGAGFHAEPLGSAVKPSRMVMMRLSIA